MSQKIGDVCKLYKLLYYNLHFMNKKFSNLTVLNLSCNIFKMFKKLRTTFTFFLIMTNKFETFLRLTRIMDLF